MTDISMSYGELPLSILFISKIYSTSDFRLFSTET